MTAGNNHDALVAVSAAMILLGQRPLLLSCWATLLLPAYSTLTGGSSSHPKLFRISPKSFSQQSSQRTAMSGLLFLPILHAQLANCPCPKSETLSSLLRRNGPAMEERKATGKPMCDASNILTTVSPKCDTGIKHMTWKKS